MKRLILTPIFVLAVVSAACSHGNGQPTSTGTPASTATLIIEPNLTGSTDVNLDDALQVAKQVLERRATAFGYDGVDIQRDGNQLVIHLPDIGRDEAAKFVKPGLLEFRELQRDASGNVAVVRNGETTFVPFPPTEPDTFHFAPAPSTTSEPAATATPLSAMEQVLQDAVWLPARGKSSDGSDEALTGRYIVEAYLAADQANMPIVDFTFNDEGASLMEQITERLVESKSPIAIFLDGEPLRMADGGIMAPAVQAVIRDKGEVTGMKLADAQYLAEVLKSGTLPVPFDVVSYESAGGS
ncbi:MAG: hypothetical protein ABSC13_05610 [Dehalococcoidia bacterium]|jgi:preprotein translocase subunit SecD